MATTLNAMFGVNVAGTDIAGNSNTSSTTVPVTRLRWRSAAPAAANAVVRAALALDSRGNLYVGTQDTATTGRLVSLTPGGTPRFNVAVGAVQSVAIAESGLNAAQVELVYVSALMGASASAVRVLGTDGGAVASASSSFCTDMLRPTYVAISLFDAGVPANGTLAEIGALTAFNPVLASAPGSFCTYVPTSGASTLLSDSSMAMPNPDGTTVLSPANLVVLGRRAYVQRTDGALSSVDVNPLATVGISGAVGGGSAPTGLAIGSSNAALVATWAGFNGSILPIATYALPGAPGPLPVTGAGWQTARPASILASAVVTSTSRVGLQWLESMNLVGTTLGLPGAVAAPVSAFDQGGTSVVVGTGNRVYAVRRDGMLFVYDAVPAMGVTGLSPVWSDNLFASTIDLVAHPTLDCSRTAPGRPGTLYAVTLDGKVAAIIVDSTKLEPTAPWPKWQRTAGNAGNPAFALNPGCP